MTSWTSNELKKIGAAEELQIASFRPDGTLRNPVTIWVVPLGDDLYIRSAHGRNAAWFRSTQVRHEGRIRAGGIEKDVSFVDIDESDHDLHTQLDAAYRTKYRRQPEAYIKPVANAESRSATIKLVPRSSGS